MTRPRDPKAPPPFYHHYVDDYDEGVRGARMELEQIGFFQLFLNAQWRAQGPLPADAKALGKVLRLDWRRVERLLRELVALGPSKISIAGGQAWNPRMQKEIAKHFRWMQRHAAQASESPAPQLPLMTLHAGGARRSAQDLGAALGRLEQRVRQRRTG